MSAVWIPLFLIGIGIIIAMILTITEVYRENRLWDEVLRLQSEVGLCDAGPSDAGRPTSRDLEEEYFGRDSI